MQYFSRDKYKKPQGARDFSKPTGNRPPALPQKAAQSGSVKRATVFQRHKNTRKSVQRLLQLYDLKSSTGQIAVTLCKLVTSTLGI